MKELIPDSIVIVNSNYHHSITPTPPPTFWKGDGQKKIECLGKLSSCHRYMSWKAYYVSCQYRL